MCGGNGNRSSYRRGETSGERKGGFGVEKRGSSDEEASLKRGFDSESRGSVYICLHRILAQTDKHTHVDGFHATPY